MPLIIVLINDQPVEAVEEFKYLGTFFFNLSFTTNTEYIKKKSNAAINWIHMI